MLTLIAFSAIFVVTDPTMLAIIFNAINYPTPIRAVAAIVSTIMTVTTPLSTEETIILPYYLLGRVSGT
jgi:hypothetical protein